MNLLELKELVEHIEQQATRQRLNLEDVQVVIPTHKLGMIGGTPNTGIKSIYLGFDWDRGKLLIIPEKTLREIDKDEIKALRDKYEELSWKKSKIDRLLRENKKLKEQLSNK